jgi:predicted DNA-binding transcriptional regulator AlpA
MTMSARIRRGPAPRRILLSRPPHTLGASRYHLGRLAHLGCMNETTHPAPGLEPVLSTSELAAHFGVPVQTIHDLRHSGRGPRGFRVGRELRYRLSEVQDWLTQLEDADDTQRVDQGGRR